MTVIALSLVLGVVTTTPAIREVTAAQTEQLIAAHKGSVVLVLFWSPTCPWCRKQLPIVRRLTETYRGRLNVVGLSTGSKEQLRGYLDFHTLPFAPIWVRPWPPGELARTVAIFGIQLGAGLRIPHVAVLDRRLRPEADFDGLASEQDLREAIDKALKR